MNKIEHSITLESSNENIENKWDILKDDGEIKRVNALKVSGANSGENYENDPEFQRLVDEYPDIFTINSVRVVDELTQLDNNIQERLDEEKVKEIMQLRQSQNLDDVMLADLETIKHLCEIYGIENVPDLNYFGGEDSNLAGFYEPNKNAIYIRRDKEDLEWRPRNMHHELRICEYLAHELWHAFQYQEMDDGSERGKKYQINMRHYQDAKGIRADIPKFENPYEQQMVEREAYVAGLSFRNFCERTLLNM